MFHRNLRRSLLCLAPLSVLLLANTFVPPIRNTGAPGDGTCASCHTGTAINGGPGSLQIVFPGGLSYTPGVKQRFLIKAAEPQLSYYGFQATARLESNLAAGQAGTWSPVDSSTVVLCDNGSQRPGTTCPGAAPVEFITHTQGMTSGTFIVDWTPPPTNLGNVRIYVSAVAADASGDGTAANDRVYLASYTLSGGGTAPTPPTITTSSPLPSGVVGTSYSQQFAATGGTGGYAWSLVSGSLPGGLSLSTGGLLNGIPNAAGSFTFSVKVTDAQNQSAQQQFSLTVSTTQQQGVTITTSSPLPGGTAGTFYTTQFSAVGGSGGYVWSQTGGTLPPPLTLSAGGVLSGTPSQAGTYSFSVTVRDSNNQTATQQFSVTMASSQPLPCTYNLSLPQTFPSTGGTQTVTVTTDSTCAWQAVANSAWLIVNGSGGGTGSGSFTVTATPNNLTVARTGSVSIGGVNLAFVQLAGGLCSFQFNPTSATFGGIGGSGTATVLTGEGCTYTVTSDSPWIAITSGSNGNVTANFTYAVSANTSGGSRTGTIRVGNTTMSISQAAQFTSSALRFVPMTPCRLVETRAAYNFEGRSGSFGPPSLSAGETRSIQVPSSGVCSIPSTAKAYFLNVTLIPKTTVDTVTVWPAGDPRPSTYTARSLDGQIVANSTVVRAGSSAGIALYASDSADVLIDISGYFTDSTAANTLAFYPVTPCRVVDTRSQYRSPAGPFGPPSMAARETRRFRMPANPYCTVPTAAAYSVTITAIPPGTLAYMTAWPSGGSQPNISSINSFAARTLANSLIVPASADGSIDIYASDATDFLLDINGYFAPDDGRGQFFYPVQQCRLSDSTVSGGAYGDNASRTTTVAGSAACPGIPTGAQGYAIAVTAIPAGNSVPYVTAYPTGSAVPNTSILNAFQGQTVTNSAIVPAGTNGAIDIYTFRRTDIIVEISGYFGR